MRTVLSPEIPGEFMVVELRMSEGSPEQLTEQAVVKIVQALQQVERDYQAEVGVDKKLIAHLLAFGKDRINGCLLYTSPSPRDATLSRMPSSA